MSGVGSGHGLAWPAHWDLGAATVPTISHLKTLIGTGGRAQGVEIYILHNHLDWTNNRIL